MLVWGWDPGRWKHRGVLAWAGCCVERGFLGGEVSWLPLGQLVCRVQLGRGRSAADTDCSAPGL